MNTITAFENAQEANHQRGLENDEALAAFEPKGDFESLSKDNFYEAVDAVLDIRFVDMAKEEDRERVEANANFFEALWEGNNDEAMQILKDIALLRTERRFEEARLAQFEAQCDRDREEARAA